MSVNRIYFDNAATTPVDPVVIEEMNEVLIHHFGNPSSLYSFGREAKMRVELARKKIAQLLEVNTGEIFFTSGGTESINTAAHMAINDLKCEAIITSPIEHHATLHSLEAISEKNNIPLYLVKLTENGHLDLNHLEELLKNSKVKTYVSLMHANNEIGNLLDVEKVGALCKEYGAVFHCDTVQTIAHYPINLKKNNVHFASAAAHKFHGPKGVGFLFINSDVQVTPMIRGGAQERNMRAGTENIAGIVGMAKALSMSLEEREIHQKYIGEIKEYFIERIKKDHPNIVFNGDFGGDCLYCLVNMGIPEAEGNNMLLMKLDIKGICVSGGSACSSGASTGSHVINQIYPGTTQTPLRISFSKYNTKEEVDRFMEVFNELVS